MAIIKNPILFSTYFNVKPDDLKRAGLVDPFTDVDTQLFVDPVLLDKSSNPIICSNAYDTYRKHFENFIRLLAISQKEGDTPWRNAKRFLNLHEPAENGLGYGGSGRSGSSRPDKIRDAIMRTAKEIIELGSKDPEMISLMGFFEENVGPDTISDFTTRVISEQLAMITERFCVEHNIAIKETDISNQHKLPVIKRSNGKEYPIVLVPIDIVRELPMANDWSGIEAAAIQNSKIRQRVNAHLGTIAKPTISDRKAILRKIATESSEHFELFLATVKEHVTCYDTNLDALGYYKLKAIFSESFEQFKQSKTYDISKSPEALLELVMDTIKYFKLHVEDRNLWEELWINGKPKKERAAQLIYYAMADCFCVANNVDISPEANMGGGPVDFKFSKGHKTRVLVEMKRSSGTVLHGYEKQLEVYKNAAQTSYGVFVVIKYGNLRKKLKQINNIRTVRLARGELASEIVVIDATPKKSASKR